MKYRLIKTYPGSLPLNSEVVHLNPYADIYSRSRMIQTGEKFDGVFKHTSESGVITQHIPYNNVVGWPEYWELVEDQEISVTFVMKTGKIRSFKSTVTSIDELLFYANLFDLKK